MFGELLLPESLLRVLDNHLHRRPVHPILIVKLLAEFEWRYVVVFVGRFISYESQSLPE